MKQRFNYITVNLINYNVNIEYSSSSAAERVLNCEKIEEDKRETKKRKKVAFMLDQIITTYQTQQLLQQKLNTLKKQLLSGINIIDR